jgi:superfamily II DNA or RNA helicase
MPDCKLIIQDEVNVKFDGVDPGTRRKMVNSLRFFLEYARHLSSYKLGRWDGHVSFATIGGSSYLNLLDVLLPIVQDAGYNIEIEDRRLIWDFEFPVVDENFTAYSKWPEGHMNAGEPIKLRDYQVEIINKLLSNTQSMVEAATGSGKTITTGALSKCVEKYGRSVIIVPNKSLVTQTEADYKLLGLDTGVYYGERKEPGHIHTVCTWQSLNILDKKKPTNDEQTEIDKFLENVICVIVDECHLGKADVLRNLLSGPFSNVPLRWGLTGTIPKEDVNGISLLASIGPVVHRLAARELQDKGVLAECHINIHQLLDVTQYKNYHEEHDFLVTDPTRLKWLAEFIQQKAESGNTLILVTRRDTGKALEEAIPGSIFLYGETKTEDRKEHYDQVAIEDKKVIIASYGIASTGINIPRIFNLILLEPGKSFVRVIQSIGRGIRKAEDKDFINIFDITSTCKFSKRHLSERKKFYHEAGYPFTQEKIDYLKKI